jgi:hypothetical protein
MTGPLVDAAPGVAGGAYGDGIAQCLAVAEHEIEPPLRRADHNGASPPLREVLVCRRRSEEQCNIL